MLQSKQLPFLLPETSNFEISISIAKRLIKTAKVLLYHELNNFTRHNPLCQRKILRITEGLWKGYELWDFV